MKSSLISRNDPFMSDHQSLMEVDPNYFLNDIGSMTKDESHVFSTFPALMEWATMDDSQLENLILDGFTDIASAPAVAASTVASSFGNSFGTSMEHTPKQSPDQFEEFLNNLKFENDTEGAEQFQNEQSFTFDNFEASNMNSNLNSAVDLTPPLTPVHQVIQDPLSACLFESGVANFEEVSSNLQLQKLQSCMSDGNGAASESSQVSSPACTEMAADIADTETSFSVYSDDNGDAESVHSFSSTASTIKRKVNEEDDDDEDYFPPSKKANKGGQAPKRAPRKTPARRNRRVQDERVKNQNKAAAMKYRAKKRTEKSTLDVLYEAEEERNKKLNSQLEELQVNIDVLKELLGKYLKKE